MNSQTEKLRIQGAAGAIEVLRDRAADAAPALGVAVIAHPHPLFGGTMNNKVAQTLARAFLALGYVLASFTRTEEAANGITQVVQFPMMFLSGVFFPIEAMPQFLQSIARLIPLTYLADALRQVMVGGTAFAPLWVCAAVLLGWLVVCFAIASRKFRWQ